MAGSTIPTPPQNDLPSSMAGPAPDRETWFTHMQPYLRPEAPQSKGMPFLANNLLLAHYSGERPVTVNSLQILEVPCAQELSKNPFSHRHKKF